MKTTATILRATNLWLHLGDMWIHRENLDWIAAIVFVIVLIALVNAIVAIAS